MYRDQNSPGGVVEVETETAVVGGWDWGPGDDVTVAVEGGERLERGKGDKTRMKVQVCEVRENQTGNMYII